MRASLPFDSLSPLAAVGTNPSRPIAEPPTSADSPQFVGNLGSWQFQRHHQRVHEGPHVSIKELPSWQVDWIPVEIDQLKSAQLPRSFLLFI